MRGAREDAVLCVSGEVLLADAFAGTAGVTAGPASG
jgi:hypothetical protein